MHNWTIKNDSVVYLKLVKLYLKIGFLLNRKFKKKRKVQLFLHKNKFYFKIIAENICI